MPSTTYPSSENLVVRPLPASERRDSSIGAEVVLKDGIDFIDPKLLTPEDRKLLQDALYEHSALVIRKQKGIDPSILPQLATVWDAQATSVHSGGSKFIKEENNILSRNAGDRIPRAPQVSVLGSGRFENYEGLPLLNLRHVNQSEFHAEPLSEEQVQNGQTRFYRWHMDAPLYERLPGRVTLIHGLKIPDTPNQWIQFENGKTLKVAPGATAFISGARAFELLTPEEQEFALNTTIQYAPRAYEWMRDCKATSDGLTIAGAGKERPLDELTEWSWDMVQNHPMAWRNPGNPDRPLLQIIGCCVYALRTTDPVTKETTEITDLAEVRRIIHRLQEKAMSPEYIYAHAWEEGDLVIFHNKGVWHSITGNLDGVDRLLWQCTMESLEKLQPARA